MLHLGPDPMQGDITHAESYWQKGGGQNKGIKKQNALRIPDPAQHQLIPGVPSNGFLFRFLASHLKGVSSDAFPVEHKSHKD